MSTTECYAMVRGSTLRVTGLRPNGALPGSGPIRYAVATSVVKVTIDEVIDSVSEELVRDTNDRPRMALDEKADVIGYRSAINFLRTDPGMLNLISAVPLATDDDGNVVGFDAHTRLPVTAFALEVWSKLSGPVCADGPKWGYTLFPFLTDGTLGGFAFAPGGAVSFQIKDARTMPGSRWNVGPHDLVDQFKRLLLPVSGNQAWFSDITDVPPPQATDGIVEKEDVLDNGSAANPMPYPLAPDSVQGGLAVSVAPDWIVDGGGA